MAAFFCAYAHMCNFSEIYAGARVLIADKGVVFVRIQSVAGSAKMRQKRGTLSPG